MIIVMNRDLAGVHLPCGARRSVSLFQELPGADLPRVQRIIDDGDDETLGFILMTDGRTLRFRLTDKTLEGLRLEGWEFLGDFDPALVRQGAADRWRQMAGSPAGPRRNSF